MSAVLPDAGGLGGEPPLGARDTRLLERAIRQRWPIPEEDREAIVAALADVVQNRRASHRNRVAAARALTAMDALNMEQEKRDQGIPDRVLVTGQMSHEVGVAESLKPYADAIAELLSGRLGYPAGLVIQQDDPAQPVAAPEATPQAGPVPPQPLP